MLTTEPISSAKNSVTTFKAMGWLVSLAYFGIPAIALIIGFYGFMPGLISAGIAPFYAYSLCLGIPLLGMLVAALVGYRLEGNLFRWGDFKDRFRIHQINKKDWLWIIALFFGSSFSLQAVRVAISPLFGQAKLFGLPAWLPAFLDPTAVQSPLSVWQQAFGELKGNWFALVVYLLFLCLNIFGEEFWWRGYILPRQELAFGKLTWVIHGTLWAFFHLFKWWDVLPLLPTTLMVSYLAYRTKNTSSIIILHFLINGLGVFGLLAGIAGLVG